MNFETWKRLSPVEEISQKLNFDIANCSSWEDYGERFRTANDRNIGHMVTRARAIIGHLSTGEVPVLQAMLHAADFSWLSDELSGDGTWQRLDRTYDDNAKAVALAILRAS
jgi:hypothetical protein